MKTSRKPVPIQACTIPAWATQFVRLCELLAETCTEADAAILSARMALGCMAELGGVNGDVYARVNAATRDYVTACAWVGWVRRAYNASPWRGDDFPATMRAALVEADAHRSASLRALNAALREVRPSLPLT